MLLLRERHHVSLGYWELHRDSKKTKRCLLWLLREALIMNIELRIEVSLVKHF